MDEKKITDLKALLEEASNKIKELQQRVDELETENSALREKLQSVDVTANKVASDIGHVESMDTNSNAASVLVENLSALGF